MNDKRAKWSLWLLITILVVMVLISIPYGNFQRKNVFVIVSFVINGIMWAAFFLTETKCHPYSFKMMHWVFCLLFFFFAAFIQYTNGRFPHTNDQSDTNILMANIFLLIWTIGIDIGSRIAKKTGTRLTRPTRRCLFTQNWNGFEKIVLPLTLINIVNAIVRIRVVGLFNLLARSTSEMTISEIQAVALIFEHGLQALTYFAVVFSLFDWKRNKTKGIVLLINSACLCISYFPTGNSRYATAVLYLGVLLTLSQRLKKGRGFSVLFLAAFLIILPFLNVFRGNAFFDVSILNAIKRVILNMPKEWLEGDYDAYNMYVLTIDYVGRHGATMGRQLLGVLLFWVPRLIWPGKPIGSGAHVAESLNWRFTNLACPLPGEAYINFGVIGIVVFSVGIGYVLTKIDNAYWKSIDVEGKHIRRIDAIYPACVVFFFFMCRGDLMSSFAFVMAYCFIWLIISTFTTNDDGILLYMADNRYIYHQWEK